MVLGSKKKEGGEGMTAEEMLARSGERKFEKT